MVGLRADDDADLDLVVIATIADQGQVLLGDGLGGFAPPIGLGLPALTRPEALDWPSGGAQELIALDPDGVPTLLAGLDAASVTVEPFPIDSFSPNGLDGAHVIDVEADGQDEVVLRVGCLISYQSVDGEVVDLGSGVSELCEAQVMPFEGEDRLVLWVPNGTGVGLRAYGGYATSAANARVTEAVSDIAGVAGLGLILAGPESTRLVRTTDAGQFDCAVAPEGVPAAERVVVGDFADNFGDEFVLYAAGQVSVWGRGG